MTDPRRQAELAQIHIAAKQLGLDRGTYEDMLFTVARVRSAAKLDFAGRQEVLRHLKSRGFRPARGRRAGGEWAWIDQAAPERRALLRKILMQLKSAGRGKAYGDSVARKMQFGERLEFCAPDQLHKIAAALAIDAERRQRSDIRE
ncbi:MAG: DUF1018 domain-containing protein [Betaproteobacteria bacterium]|nr:DUF1018 domain-containing protein [Betaproteobacteria bacterium]